MKTNVLSWFIMGLLLLFTGCSSFRMATIPTRTYIYDKQDSILLKGGTFELDGLKVLLINQTVGTTQVDVLSEDSIRKSKNSMGAKYSEIFSFIFEGSFQDQFSDIAFLKVAQQLQTKTDVFVANSKNRLINQRQIDSIARKLDVDVIILTKMIRYDVRVEGGYSDYSNNMSPFVNIMMAQSFSSTSKRTCIPFKSTWEIMWVDKQTKQIQRRQQIVQTGQYYNTRRWMGWTGEMFACALRIANDFVKIFKV